VTRCFGETHIARDDGAIDLAGKVRHELGGDLIRQVVARIMHGAHDTLDPQPALRLARIWLMVSSSADRPSNA
jgi:hypothetical protein